MKADKTMNPYFYLTGWILIGLAAGYALLESVFHLHLIERVPPCAFHVVTGLYCPGCSFLKNTGMYCPGCGGTRAVFALLRGKILRSVYFHPVVLYTAAVGGWFMISQTIERLSRGKLKIGLNFRTVYLWIALILIVANFVIKNAVLLAAGTALLG